MMPDIPKWAVHSVETLHQVGIVTGYPDNTFRPDRVVTREEAAALIVQMLNWQYRISDDETRTMHGSEDER